MDGYKFKKVRMINNVVVKRGNNFWFCFCLCIVKGYYLEFGR